MVICNSVIKFVLKNIDLHIPKGEVVGVIGASSSGKTTFLKLLAGLLQPESGEIYVNRCNPLGKNIATLRETAALFAKVPVFDEKENLWDYFNKIPIMYGLKKSEFDDRLRSVSEALDFEKYMDLKVTDLSFGMRRRAELGTIFCRDAKLYLIDEPCLGLDQNGKEAFYEIVRKCQREGSTVIIASHNMEDIKNVADRIILLNEGQVVFYGDIEELHKRFIPMDECFVQYEGRLPDLSDLEIEQYRIDNDKIQIRYNSNHVTSKEVIEHILSCTRIKSVHIKQEDLSESIKTVKAISENG